MKRFFGILAVALVLPGLQICANAAHNFDDAFTYEIYYWPGMLQVTFQYTTDANGKLFLEYDNEAFGENSLFNCIDSLITSPKYQAIKWKPAVNSIEVSAEPGKNIEIVYFLKQDYGSPVLNRHRYRPIIQDDYFHLIGQTFFIKPVSLFSGVDKKLIHLHWKNFKEVKTIANSFGSGEQQWLRVDKQELNSSIFIGGSFSHSAVKENGLSFNFLKRDHWQTPSSETTLHTLREVIRSYRQFWKDYSDTIYTVTLIPTYEPWTDFSKSYSIGGTALVNSFASFISDNPGPTKEKVRWLYYHELMHHWIGKKIANENEEKQYWFSEGFTDYYAYKFMLRNNEIDVFKFIDVINTEMIIPHYSSSISEYPNSSITYDKFWSESAYNALPYKRGFLYAFYLDNKIKIRSGLTSSLDALMKQIFKVCTEQKLRFSHEVFKETLKHHLEAEAVDQFERHIVEGKLIDFKNDLLGGLSLIENAGYPQIQIDKDMNPSKVKSVLER